MKFCTILCIVLVYVFTNTESSPIQSTDGYNQSYNQHNPEESSGNYEGDIVLPPPSVAGRGVGIRGMGNRWANNVVPYEISPNITAGHATLIVNMMRAMENLTAVNNRACISFRPKTSSDRYFITIFNGSGCSAPIGSWGNYLGIRPVSLYHSPSATCMITGIIQHELTHVLGFYHEQSRPDRDSYVSINWNNIYSNQAFNFDKYTDAQVDTQMTSYDYGSVMHYERNAFAINRNISTITPTRNTSAFIGQRVQLSPIDILEIQRYYGCVSTPTTTISWSHAAYHTGGGMALFFFQILTLFVVFG